MEPPNKPAREGKAKAYWQLAALPTNPNWRYWYITAANELRGYTPRQAVAGGLISPGIVQALPYEDWVNQWTMRLLAEQTTPNNVDTSLGIAFDNVERYVLHIRKAICKLVVVKSAAELNAATNVIFLTKGTEEKFVYADMPNAVRTIPRRSRSSWPAAPCR